MSSILNTTALIKTIKRRAFIPKDQRTFSDEDFLEMATEEINIGLMDQLIKARGDYLVYYKDFLIEEDVTHYNIPPRAHGNKLRDARIVDENGVTIQELAQISLEEVVEEDCINYITETFYIQNDQLVIDPTRFPDGSYLRMYFYMRPNKLVLPARGATILEYQTTLVIDSVDPATNGIEFITTEGEVGTGDVGSLAVGDIVSITGTDGGISDDNYTVTEVGTSSFKVDGDFPVPITMGTWEKLATVYSITVDTIPSNFSTDNEFDLTGALSPNKIKDYNFNINSLNLVTKVITIRTSDISNSFVVGDFITQAEETIVPNVPTEYHPVIAQRVAIACLEAMGDEQNKQSAERKLAQMEKAVLSIVTNRVEGAPKKIKNRHGTLNQAIRRNRSWSK